MSKHPKLPAFQENRTPPKHPDDVALEAESIREAKKYGPALLDSAPGLDKYLRRLVLTYADADAHDALDALREWFWSLTLGPKP